MSAVDAAPRRGRPRSAASEERIIDAALDLLAEGHGPAAISIAEIARRAGTGKDTIYRRWPGKEELLIDAIESTVRPSTATDDGPFREQLVDALAEMIRRTQDERTLRILVAIRGTGDDFPRLRARYWDEVVAERRERVNRYVAAAVARGELRSDIDLRGIGLMPFEYVIERAIGGEPLTGDPREEAERLIELLVGGIGARPSS